MGSVKKVVSSAVSAVSLGTVNLNKQKKVSGYTGDLQQEARKTAAQRKNLLMTGGGILGEEVESVGKKKRGTILGN